MLLAWRLAEKMVQESDCFQDTLVKVYRVAQVCIESSQTNLLIRSLRDRNPNVVLAEGTILVLPRCNSLLGVQVDKDSKLLLMVDERPASVNEGEGV